MASLPATNSAPYEVLALIGKGGMGEVHRAKDTKLKRDVAIKFLPAALGHDPKVRRLADRIAAGAVPLEETIHIAHLVGNAYDVSSGEARVHAGMGIEQFIAFVYYWPTTLGRYFAGRRRGR